MTKSRTWPPGVLAVAGVTLANGGNNIGVYVPVFAVADSLWIYAKWGHIALPVVLIAIGPLVLFSG